MKKYKSFLSEKFQFLEVKFSIYWIGVFFVMSVEAVVGCGKGQEATVKGISLLKSLLYTYDNLSFFLNVCKS